MTLIGQTLNQAQVMPALDARTTAARVSHQDTMENLAFADVSGLDLEVLSKYC
jgi:hypothetical protein